MAQSRNEIITNLWNDTLINEIIWKITNSVNGRLLREDLKQELFVILLEMDENKIKSAFNNNYLHYLCVNILKKQYHSKTSPFYKKFRSARHEELGNWNEIDSLFNELIEAKESDELFKKIKWIVDNKLDLVDRELFKLYYKWDKYDRWLGELKDTTCQKPISSYRKIEKKLSLTTLEDGRIISIGRSTISLSHKRSIEKIRKWLQKLN